ncbi:MAG: hypothetical protein HY233_06825 [Acidobacteriales bacterium]|nr:hypothetical protein [Candidatus Koribacter versatilis]MBI3645660.1 hypothetical protein [Terriglobales bacterium]
MSLLPCPVPLLRARISALMQRFSAIVLRPASADNLFRRAFRAGLLSLLLAAVANSVAAQEAPYFVTYDHHMEEPGNLEIATWTTLGVPRSGQKLFFAPFSEFEYGVTARWTTELYLESQATSGDSAVFTGWRLENRFKPLKREHWINPILYFEYEAINEASKIHKEVVGNAGISDERNAELAATNAHEIEAKLILSSNLHDWNLAGNFIVEKNLSQDEGFEFGYALGVARPLAKLASGAECRFCRENFTAGLELYGGLGSTNGFGFHETAHYLAPVISWQLSDNSSLHFSPLVGLTNVSYPLLLRFGYAYEIRAFGRKVAQMFGGKP